MTFEALELALPNGLHDVFILAVTFDAVLRKVELKLSMDAGTEDDVEREHRRVGRLTALAVELFIIEAPDSLYPFQLDGSGVAASGDRKFEGLDSKMEEVIERLPTGADRYRFFLHDSNSFIYLFAADVRFNWD